MATLRLILGDQLSHSLSALDGVVKGDVILMMEVMEEATYVRHHKQKIAFLFSAMRHFAEELRAKGHEVDYVKLDDPQNRGSFTQEIERALTRHQISNIIATEPGEWRVLEMLRLGATRWAVPLEMREDDRFFCTRGRFARWAEGRKTFRMEFFYREMRRETGLLMEADAPIGGEWNFDKENRKRLPSDQRPPRRQRFEPDTITQEVIALVEARFGEHFGSCDAFGWAVTRADALRALAHFIEDALPSFGDYQDAMKQGEPFLYHSIISPYLNCGLLEAREICVAAERAYQKGNAPLNAVEGFVRQILGWREYVRGIYWLKMPHYATTNALEAKRPLPPFFWTAETQMNCIAQVVRETSAHAYAHHIQRLMVTGNFALLAGLAPKEVEAWYLSVYADAFDWVELPNVHGMVMFADHGLLASKPYAASGAYIHRMSDYCTHCHYKVADKSGKDACPFNLLYWNFLIENESKLARNPRMAMPYRNLKNMDATRREEIEREASAFLASMYDAPTKPVQASLDL